ncbi:MAG: hypothetical protein KDC34_11240 [Saprospiraceae bacterium]|nr:hypothetical protein [Saprospiraceae bacterium]
MNNKILEIIEPYHNAWGMTFWLSTLFALMAGAALWFFLRGKPEKWTQNMRMLMAMLAFFGVLLAGGTAFFQGWTHLKKGPIVFYENQFKSGFGTTPYAEISLIRKEMVQQTAPFNPAIKTGVPMWILVVKGKADQVHMLSGEDYPIDEIAQKLEERMKKEQEE